MVAVMEPPSQLPEDAALTRVTLLKRLRDPADQESWREFYETYAVMVRGLARKRGLTSHEAEDVAQEVFKRLVKEIQTFEHNHRPGAFRNFLYRLTRWRADDKLRESRRDYAAAAHQMRDEEDGTSTIDQVPSPLGPDAFELEARRHLLSVLFQSIEGQVPAKHLQVFQLHVIDEVPIDQVAQMFKISQATVYVIKHRVAQKLKAEVERRGLDTF